MRVRPFAAALLAIMLATAPGLAFARAGRRQLDGEPWQLHLFRSAGYAHGPVRG